MKTNTRLDFKSSFPGWKKYEIRDMLVWKATSRVNQNNKDFHSNQVLHSRLYNPDIKRFLWPKQFCPYISSLFFNSQYLLGPDKLLNIYVWVRQIIFSYLSWSDISYSALCLDELCARKNTMKKIMTDRPTDWPTNQRTEGVIGKLQFQPVPAICLYVAIFSRCLMVLWGCILNHHYYKYYYYYY